MKIEETAYWSILRKLYFRPRGYLHPDRISFNWLAWFFEIEKPANKACSGLWLCARKIGVVLGFRQSH